MDIENFSKTEIILAAFFISFVTAILAGAIVILLSEDAPREIIRVTDRVIDGEVATTSEASVTDKQNEEIQSELSRDEILETAVRSVARITSSKTSPQAGVLVTTRNHQNIVITEKADFTATTTQALFEDGTVANLGSEKTISFDSFTALPVEESSNQLYPLEISSSDLGMGEGIYLVPLSEQPEIIQVSISDVSGQHVSISSDRDVPAISLLIDKKANLIAVYEVVSEKFRILNSELD